jgi:glucosamine--fructose-6-phosphate aminotransferase (isomerizing)
MIGRDFPVLVITPSGRSQPGMRDLIEKLRDRGAELVVVSDERTILDKASARFHMPDSLPEELSPMPVSSAASIRRGSTPSGHPSSPNCHSG